jgi:hypothetical protein
MSSSAGSVASGSASSADSAASSSSSSSSPSSSSSGGRRRGGGGGGGSRSAVARLTQARPHAVAAALVLTGVLAVRLSFRFFTGGWAPAFAALGSAGGAPAAADSALLADCRWRREAQAAAGLAAGADVNAAGSDGVSPLQLALWYGLSDGFARSLLAAGADVHHRDSFGFTPLVYAGAGGRAEMAEALVAAGADVSHANAGGDSALTLACLRGHDDLALWLVGKGAALNQRNSNLRTALDYCEETRSPLTARALRALGALTGAEITAAAAAAAAATISA